MARNKITLRDYLTTTPTEATANITLPDGKKVCLFNDRAQIPRDTKHVYEINELEEILLMAATESNPELQSSLLSKAKKHAARIAHECDIQQAWEWAQAKVAALCSISATEQEGTKVCLLKTSSPYNGQDGKANRHELIVREATEIRVAEKRIRKLRSEIKGLSKPQGKQKSGLSAQWTAPGDTRDYERLKGDLRDVDQDDEEELPKARVKREPSVQKEDTEDV